MPTVDLGQIKGEQGERGIQGGTGIQGVQGEQGNDGICPTIQIGTVTTGAEGSSAAATITGTFPDYLLNLTIPRGASDGGDMKMSVYDTQGEKTDIFAYITEHAITVSGGTFTGAVILKGAPTENLEAATKQYVDDTDTDIRTDINTFVAAFNASEAAVQRDVKGTVIFDSLGFSKTFNPVISKNTAGVTQWSSDSEEFEITAGGHRDFLTVLPSSIYSTVLTNNGSYVNTNAWYLVDASGNEYALGEKIKVSTPSNFKLRYKFEGYNNSPTATFTKLDVAFEKRISLSGVEA